MDPSSSNILGCDDETGALETLFDAFHSVCSSEEIASAYCTAQGDVMMAGDILYQLQESNSLGVVHEQNGESKFSQSEGSLFECHEKSTNIDEYPGGSKQRKLSASLGTVSTVLGKVYARPSLSINGTSTKNKPLKLEVHESLMDELDVEPVLSDSAPRKKVFNDKDVEEFLFSMLGDGFKLNKDAIREVLSSCGYDIKKSIGELLALSTKTLEKVEGVDRYMSQELAGKCSMTGTCLSEGSRPQSSLTRSNSGESPSMQKEKSNLSREVLESLFTLPEKSGEEPKRKRLELGLNRTRVIGQKVITKPLEDIASSHLTDIPKRKVEENNDAVVEDDDYQLLRSAAKQHWNAMKAYYEAAVDAFTVGDRQRATYLLEQGKNYNQMAREADEKSARKIIEPRKPEIREVPLDLSVLNAREALRLLKLHVSNLANIPSFHYLKVILEADGGELKKGKRSRMVKKLLEKESIGWIEEEGNPGTIFIQLDQIDPSKLSF
ncbi:putative nuclear RNA export factor SDE5 [Typha angustifolia]|uniref:putative nuclear RNA export factor SDE5 n=1 Tax=Typha angustifolia TaxID=59011 RepID=UPI003C2FA9F0